MQMFLQFKKQLDQGQYTGIPPAGTKTKKKVSLVTIIFRTIWGMRTDRNADTQIQPVIVRHADMISNQHTHRSTVLTKRASIMRRRQLITKWAASPPIATLPLRPNEGVGR